MPVAMQPRKDFYLKGTVIVRALAEVAALCIVALLPLSYFFIDTVRHLPLALQIAGIVAAVTAIVVLPFYGLVVWHIRIEEDCITLQALRRKHKLGWPAIAHLSLRTTLKSPEYLLTTNEGQFYFQARFERQEELVAAIRKHLPNGGRIALTLNAFVQSKVILWLEIGKVIFCFGIIVVAWSFYAQVGLSHHTSVADSVLLASACVFGTAVVLARGIAIFFMPKEIQLQKDQVRIRLLIGQRNLSKADPCKVTSPLFFLPNGIVLKSPRGSFLITDRLERYDELREELEQRYGGAGSPVRPV